MEAEMTKKMTNAELVIKLANVRRERDIALDMANKQIARGSELERDILDKDLAIARLYDEIRDEQLKYNALLAESQEAIKLVAKIMGEKQIQIQPPWWFTDQDNMPF